MKYFVLDKDTDELVEVLENISQHDIEKYELENPDKYILDEDNLEDDFDEEQVIIDLMYGEDDEW